MGDGRLLHRTLLDLSFRNINIKYSLYTKEMTFPVGKPDKKHLI